METIRTMKSASASRMAVGQLNCRIGRFVSNPWTLLVCKLTIGAISAIDIYLTVKYVNSLPNLELNPLGRWLMKLDRGIECELQQVASFISAKFVGNFVALSVIELLCSWKRYLASSVAIALATFQLFLLFFLLYG